MAIGPLCLAVARGDEHTTDRSERKRQCSRPEKSCFPLQLFSVPLLDSRQVLLLPTHLAALTSNAMAANRRPLDVYRIVGSDCKRQSSLAAVAPVLGNGRHEKSRATNVRLVGPPSSKEGNDGNRVVLDSVITCPHCDVARMVRMPVDACQIVYACTGCGVVLRPRPGDCCVFCSYGSVPCPPVQVAGAMSPCAP